MAKLKTTTFIVYKPKKAGYAVIGQDVKKYEAGQVFLEKPSCSTTKAEADVKVKAAK